MHKSLQNILTVYSYYQYTVWWFVHNQCVISFAFFSKSVYHLELTRNLGLALQGFQLQGTEQAESKE